MQLRWRIGVDICRDIPSNPYPLATPDDLAETERSVKEFGRRVVARVADVRERHELREANAGILPMAMGRPHDATKLYGHVTSGPSGQLFPGVPNQPR